MKIMDKDMDTYISRSLKNWAAKKRLPADGRQRLLLAVTQLKPARDPLGLRIWLALNHDHPAKPVTYPDAKKGFYPGSQSRVLSFYIATNWRLAS